MSNWKENLKYLGEVKKKSVVQVQFEGTDEIKEIVSITASCGCTTPIYDKESKILSVLFKTGIIPFHLRKQGYYTATKKLTVVYKDGTTEELFINAKIVN